MFSHIELNTYRKLPIEVLMEIFSYLSVQDAGQLSRVNHDFNAIVNDSTWWKNKLKQHFAHVFNPHDDVMSFREQFIRTYTKEYEGLSPLAKRLFSLTKESDVEQFKKSGASLHDLDSSDSHGYTLLDWAIKNPNQKLLDHCYTLALQHYLKPCADQVMMRTDAFDVIKTDYKGRTLLHWAILCHQSITTLEQLIKLNDSLVINSSDDTLTLLFCAAMSNNVPAIDFLLDNEANIDAIGSQPDLCSLLLPEGYRYQYGRFIKSTEGSTIDSGTRSTLAHINLIGKEVVLAKATPLSIAARYGHLNAMNKLLERGAHTEVRESIPSLISAVIHGDQNGVNTLLKYRADVNVVCQNENDPSDVGYSALHFAALKGNFPIVKLLLEAGASVNHIHKNRHDSDGTPLDLAVSEGHIDVVTILLQYGACEANRDEYCIDESYVIRSAFETQDPLSMIKLLLKYPNQIAVNFPDVIYDAIDKNMGAELIKLLLQAGSSPDGEGYAYQPLYLAIEKNNFEAVEILLQAGASPNGHGDEEYDRDLDYPLDLAIKEKRYDLVKLLLAAGANILLRQNDHSSLHVAAGVGCKEIMRLLLERDATHLETMNEEGLIPKAVAFKAKDFKMVEFLERWTDKIRPERRAEIRAELRAEIMAEIRAEIEYSRKRKRAEESAQAVLPSSVMDIETNKVQPQHGFFSSKKQRTAANPTNLHLEEEEKPSCYEKRV